MHYSFLLSQLIHQLKEIDGRKKLQKIVHILKSAGGPFEERFEYANFGPYSETLRAEVESLCEHRYISEAPNGSSFKFTKGERFAEIEAEDFIADTPIWAAFAQRLNGFTPRELETLSTVLFLRELDLAGQELRTRFEGLKPHLTHHFDWAVDAAEKIIRSRNDWEALPETIKAAS